MIAGLVVVLDANLHPDQAAETKRALWALKGVIGVVEVYENAETAVRDTRAVIREMRG